MNSYNLYVPHVLINQSYIYVSHRFQLINQLITLFYVSYSYKKTNEKIHEVSARIASTDAWVQPSLLSAVDSGIWIGDGCKMFYELSLSSCNRLYKNPQ